MTETDHYIDLMIRSSDRAVDTSLRIPLAAPLEQREAMVRMWIDAIRRAMEITLAPESKSVDSSKAGGPDEISDRSSAIARPTRRRRPGHGQL